VKRKRESDPDDPWASLSRDELIQRCEQLEKHVKQLRNTLAKMTAKEQREKKRKIDRAGRPFDFSKHSKRHVLLKFVYLGWDYHVRETAEPPVGNNTDSSGSLFRAMLCRKRLRKRWKTSYSMR
jgi:hypothetical protein